MFKVYYQLTKPGIIYGNALTAIAGFLLASHDHIEFKLFAGVLIGLSLVIASGCVLNNVYDVQIDAAMDRTKNRAMVKGLISKPSAIIFGIILLIGGVLALSLGTNNLALCAALTGWIVYVLFYTPLKHRTEYATLIGAIAGATPPVVGYAAVTNKLDTGAIILFLILVFWQMPHFYAIAIRRLKDYSAAKIPVLPATRGILVTKIHMLLCIIGFIIAATALTYFKFTGYLYLIIVGLLGLVWLGKGIKGFRIADDEANAESDEALAKLDNMWAKKMFLFSLIVLTSLCVIIPIDVLIK